MGGRRKALIIAADDYDHPGLRRLRSPAADAEALGTVLSDPRIGDFEVDVVCNEPSHEVQSRIEDLFCDAKADDVLLLHFSGHGLKGEAGDLFFAARNTRPNRLASTAVPADFVQRCVRTSPSRSIVLLLDCCYGGAFSQGVAVRAAGDVQVLDSFPSSGLGGGRGRAVITASNSMEYAFEGEKLSDDSKPAPSPFTAALVEGLSTGEADRDEDGFVSLNELYDYVFDRVRERNPNQTPSRDIEMQGELYVAKSGRRRLNPAPLPADLRAATEDTSPYARLGAVAELRSRLLSENLPVAAGAREALARMASEDTQLVAGAATEALRAQTLTATPTSLDFGQVPVGMRSDSQAVTLSGPPLARHVTVQPSEPWIRCQGGGATYEVCVTPQSAEECNGSLMFRGVGVEATVTVRVCGYPASSSLDTPTEPLSEPGTQVHRASQQLPSAAVDVPAAGTRGSAKPDVPVLADAPVDGTAEAPPQHSDEGIGVPPNGDAHSPTQDASPHTDPPRAASSTAQTARAPASGTTGRSVGKHHAYSAWGLLVGVVLFVIGGITNIEILLTVGFLLFLGCSVALVISAVRDLINRRKGPPAS